MCFFFLPCGESMGPSPLSLSPRPWNATYEPVRSGQAVVARIFFGVRTYSNYIHTHVAALDAATG